MLTRTEKQIVRKRFNVGKILLPYIEDFIETGEARINSQEDIGFIQELAEKTIEREEKRKAELVFSPSSLSVCLRQVYLKKNFERFNITPVNKLKIEDYYYFVTGDWNHFKWQFVLYKMDQSGMFPDYKLIDVERRVKSDFYGVAGTIDVIFEKSKEIFAGDFKGLNVNSFRKISNGLVPEEYSFQISNYAWLYGTEIGKKIFGILFTENKGGPDHRHLIALHESLIDCGSYFPFINSRLKLLMTYQKKNKSSQLPDVECHSVKLRQFLDCPFSEFCRKEVRKVEKNRHG